VASDVGRFGSGDQGSRHREKREEKCYGQQELDLDRRPAPLYFLRLPKWGHRDEEPQQVSLFSDHRPKKREVVHVAVGCKEQDFAEMSEVRWVRTRRQEEKEGGYDQRVE
jgi:hypothetical protein